MLLLALTLVVGANAQWKDGWACNGWGNIDQIFDTWNPSNPGPSEFDDEAHAKRVCADGCDARDDCISAELEYIDTTNAQCSIYDGNCADGWENWSTTNSIYVKPTVIETPAPVTTSRGEWIDKQYCQGGWLLPAVFSSDRSYATVNDARAACASACDANDDCKFANLDYLASAPRATCYLHNDDCGDYMSSYHNLMQIYVKGAGAPVEPVDCVLSDWGEWSTCSEDCDGGTQVQTRVVTTAASNGGKCDAELSRSRACNEQACPPAATKWTYQEFENWCSDDEIRCKAVCHGDMYFQDKCYWEKERKQYRCKNYKREGICDKLPSCTEKTKTHRNGLTKTRCKGKILFAE